MKKKEYFGLHKDGTTRKKITILEHQSQQRMGYLYVLDGAQ